jgi:hypothetical protein
MKNGNVGISVDAFVGGVVERNLGAPRDTWRLRLHLSNEDVILPVLYLENLDGGGGEKLLFEFKSQEDLSTFAKALCSATRLLLPDVSAARMAPSAADSGREREGL